MDSKSTGLIAAVVGGIVVCFCGALFLLISSMLAGVSIPLIITFADVSDNALTPALTATPTRDVSRATAVLVTPVETPSPYSAFHEEAEEIGQQVSMLRGLEPAEPIRCDFFTEDELHLLLEEADPLIALSEADRITFAALGLYDPLEPVLLDELVPQEILLAVLDEQQDSCSVLWEGPGQAGWQAEYARSYARALIRQNYFGVGEGSCSLFLPAYDSCLAHRALLEGDAFLVTRQWQRQFGSPEWNPPVLLRELWPDSFLGRMAAFPHLTGYGYVQQAYLEDGWAGVDHLYSSPPGTTHQVLHPDTRWEPLDLEPVEDYSTVLGEGWELANSGTMGEWLIQLFLERDLSEEDAWAAAEGWRMDLFQIYRHRDSGETILLWAAEWQTIPDAYSARSALSDVARSRFDEVSFATVDEITAGSGPALRIDRIGLQTLMITGPDPELVESLREQVIFPVRSPQQ